jgi:phenylacetate-coenzyme A ligase PaaK-like adenylate-forming protein
MTRLRILNFSEMVRDQWRFLAELEALQSRRLRRLVQQASVSVPFYRDLFRDCGLQAEEIRSPADLRHIPITTKQQLQSAGQDEITSRRLDLSRCVPVSTSGSTGLPLRFFFTRSDYSRLNMNWIRPLLAHGVRPWQKKFEITGPHNISRRKSWYNHLGLWNRQMVSLFEAPDQWVEGWRSSRADFLAGYSQSLRLFADHVIRKGITDIRPRFVFGVSDLADEDCRQLIERAFKKRYVDLYGAVESGCIAWECPDCSGYHINVDTLIVEFLKNGQPAPPGTPGKIVVTNLFSQAMPLIRYELGDVGVRSVQEPTCGRGLPLMEIVEGRSDAFLVLPSGRRLSPMTFYGLMKPLQGIKQWKVLQPDTRHLIIRVVPGPGFSDQTREQIRRRVAEVIPEKIELEIQTVETIPPEASGKVRAVVSEVKSAF